MTGPRFGERRRWTVRIRRDLGLQVKPEAEQIDGQTYAFDWMGTCEDDHSRYPGEAMWMAMDPAYPADAPWWIPEGDLAEPGPESDGGETD